MPSVVAADLVAFHAATQSDIDTGTVGGAIDLLRRPDYTQIAANDTIEALSSAAGDTSQTVTITGRNAGGSIVTETKTLTGVTAIAFSTLGTVTRVLQAELSATCAGTITVRRATGAVLIRTIPIGERGFSAIFRKTTSLTSGTQNYYAAFFWKNTSSTNSLLSATVSESADPQAVITHGLAVAVNDSTTTTTRLTAPSGVTIDGTAKVVPGTDLAATAAIKVWLNMTLAANAAAFSSSYTSSISGSTT